MTSRVDVAEVDILNGLLSAAIPFQPGLNIVSGENGTLKTKLLQEIKSNRFRPTVGATGMPKIQAISPKRNSERRAVEVMIQTLRQQNKTFDSYVSERGGAQINDATFDNYPSLGELFYFVYEHRCRDGGSQKEHMVYVTDEFNSVISKVFPEYELSSEWITNTGIPTLELIKHRSNHVPLEALSLGEQEVLSLVTSLYASREVYDVFLIDEPEVHLNWHLEERLFSFLDDFGTSYNRQIIVATHSRVVFLERFLSKTIFLYWNTVEGKVEWGKDLSPVLRKRIAGEAIEIIRLGPLPSLTFFVEDSSHEAVIKSISERINAHPLISVCGNSPNVRSLYKRSKVDGTWENSYFLEDGDNEGSPFPDEDRFIHLDKYCIENYLLDLRVISAITGKNDDDLSRMVFESVIANKHKILGKTKFLEFLLDQLKPEDLYEERMAMLDASLILPDFIRKLGLTFDEYLGKYIDQLKTDDLLDVVFPEELITAILASS